jgi:hypothetical protein
VLTEHSTLLFKGGAAHNMKEKHLELQSKGLINSKTNFKKSEQKYNEIYLLFVKLCVNKLNLVI